MSLPNTVRAQCEQPCINYHKLAECSLNKQGLDESFPANWVARLALKPIKIPLRSTRTSRLEEPNKNWGRKCCSGKLDVKNDYYSYYYYMSPYTAVLLCFIKLLLGFNAQLSSG